MLKPQAYRLLVLLIIFIKGHEGFFIKHSSGLCLQPNSEPYNKGNQKAVNLLHRYGPIYFVLFQNTCLHPDAQFRFYEKFNVLYNIDKNGTFLTRPPSDSSSHEGGKYQIYHSPHPLSKTTLIYSPRFIMKQTPSGSLKLINSVPPYCATSGTSIIPVNGSYVIQTTNCTDETEQKFTFGSVTCEGQKTTDVNCHSEQVMIIKNAAYGGRSDMQTCGYNENTNCTISVTCLVKRLCGGKQNCSITVNQNLFNNDPCPRKSKYLYFEYVCADQPDAIKHLLVSDVKLSSSILPNEGYLEITINNKRNKVCDKSLDNKGKRVVCREFGYQGVKQKVSSVLVDDINSQHFSGNLTCTGKEATLIHCCVTEATPQQDCSKFASISCRICSEPLLQDTVKFSDSIFTASSSSKNHAPAKARLSSNSSWCAPANDANYLDIDFGVVYVINSVTIFGDAVSENWTTSYKLNYMRDGTNWMEWTAGRNKVLPGNKNAYNDASTIKLNGIRARVVRFIPISSHGQKCMRIEICGHKLLPEKLRSLTFTSVTSSTVAFSWIPPIIDKWEKPILFMRIKIQEKISRSVVLYIDETTKTNKTEVEDLSPYTEYELTIAAGNIYGFGKEINVTFTTAEAAPSGPPRNVSVIAQSSSSLSVSWNEPEKDKQNGVITNYTVCLTHLKDGPCFQKLTTVSKNSIIAALQASMKYYVKVLASTKVGSGNFSDSEERFTNTKPLKEFSKRTPTTLSYELEIPIGIYSHFQVIALKLSDGKTPSKYPDSYSENELRTYEEAKSSTQPMPYIAAVIAMSEKLNEFVLGDGRNSTTPTRRRRRSNTDVYYNGPLEPGTSYSVFQRIYKDKDNYYSSDWSAPAETGKTLTPTPAKATEAPKSCPECSQTVFYIIIALLVVIIVVLIIVVVYLTVRLQRSRTPTPKDKVIANIENKSFSADTYEEVQFPPPSSSTYQNLESKNKSSDHYEDLQHTGKEDEHAYQSLQKTT